MIYSEEDILDAVGERAFRNGEEYRRKARVLRFSWSDTSTLIATVKGSNSNVYHQTIELTAGPVGMVSIEGDCTCPVNFNCKHVAAALLVARLTADIETAKAAGRQKAAQAAGARPEIAAATNSAVRKVAAISDLSPELLSWFGSLVRAEEDASDDYPATVSQRLVYVFSDETFGTQGPRLCLKIKSTRLLKNGTFSTSASDYLLSNIRNPDIPKFVRPADIAILEALLSLSRGVNDAAATLRTERGAPILSDILATGRARWGDVNGPEIAAGPPMAGRIVWVNNGEQALRPKLVIDVDEEASISPDHLLIMTAAPPVYVNLSEGLMGPIETGFSAKVANTLLSGPAVPAAQIDLLNRTFAGASTTIARAAPPELKTPIMVSQPPLAVLRLMAAKMPVQSAGYYYYAQRPQESVALARPMFRYGEFDIPATEKNRVVDRIQGLQRFEIRRQLKAERASLTVLADAGLRKISKLRQDTPAANRNDLAPENQPEGWFEFLYDVVPRLKAAGWEVDVDDDFPIKLLRGDSAFEARVNESSGLDWFEFDLGIIIDGERIDMIEPLVAFLEAAGIRSRNLDALDPEMIIHLGLPDGRYLSVPLRRILPIVETLSLLLSGISSGSGGTGMRFAALDASILAALEASDAQTGAIWTGGDRVRALGARLRDTGGIADVALPDSFKATLRPYQAKGVSWLSFLVDAGIGGILADDMGLGKTVQALGLICREKADNRLTSPVLVIAPTSLMVNWRREAEKFAPDLKVLILQGLDRKTRFEDIDGSDIVLTTYPLIARDHDVLSARMWHMIILDEAQTIKNPNATTTRLIHGLKSRHRFCLSGTPLENHLGELWSLFHFVSPGFLGDQKSFGAAWRRPIEKHGDGARARMLAQRIKPFLLRRTKDEVAADLPAKTEIIERVEFAPAQRNLYESVRLAMHDKVVAVLAQKGLARSRIVVLDALLKMRQACCDPRLVKLPGKAKGVIGSAKLERLMEMVTELVAEGRKILIFSQFTSMLDLIRPLLTEANVPYALLTGDTVDRQSQVGLFQDGKVPVFLVSLKAGGVGLNLTAADTVILYDPWWNPAVENQAIDRAHRIGQDKPVFVHKLVATGTIEEKIEILKARKQALADSIFDHDGTPTLSITEDDIAMLFSRD